MSNLQSRIGVALVALLFVATISCGDSATEPQIAPPPPDPHRATTVTVGPASATLTALGDTVRLTARVQDQNGQLMAGAAVNWTSSHASVATVNASGLVTARGDGEALITATSGTASGGAAITIEREASAVVVTPAEVALAPGDTVRLSALVEDARGLSIEHAEVGWSSSDTGVAVVDAAGLVRAVAKGEATITATSGAVSGTVTVTVTASASAVVVTPAEATLAVGDTIRLWAEVHDAEGAPIADAVITWGTSHASVATVDAAGLVRAVAAGNAIITVTARTASASASATAGITVVGPSDRGALVSLYRSTGGAKWVSKTNWLADVPLGEWYGVTVNGTGRVVHLELDSNNLIGPIPPHMAQLTRLQRLSLEDNTLSGRIPPELGNLSRLDYLMLRHNVLTGEIPGELGRLARMTTLGLANNKLSGRIPPELGNLTRLSWLDLDVNDLTGEIPSELAVPSLQSLSVRGNLLSGPVPSSFLTSRLESFGFVRPRYRNLYLCLPGTPDFVAWAERVANPDPRFCNESDRAVLESLHQSTRGASWTNSDGWLSGPAVSRWHGVESDELGRVVALNLTGNGLSGELAARLGHLAAMTELKIADNPLTGRLPTSLTALSLQEFRYSGTELCTPADTSFRAWLNTVPAHEGTDVECAPTSDRDILAILYRATDGPNWMHSDNWLTEAPLETWHGVGVDARGRVVSLNLNYNNLTGVIPPELGQLAHLEDLRMYENPLTGPIPPELGDLSNLRVLFLFFTQLTGAIPSELGNLSALEELWLQRIPLMGSIPPELGELSRLRFLSLGESNISGPIPPELGRLARLEKLYLGDNRLSGSIPRELGNLTRLNTLGLQENDLSGSIPAELGALSSLEYAWFHDNNLTGPLPRELGGLSSARVLVLGNNDLSGTLPATFGRMTQLEFLNVSNNAGMSGVLPGSLEALDRLDTFLAGGTRLCAPGDPDFQAWLATVAHRRVLRCPTGERSMAYLTQAVQSLEYPVPLVADERALLRVFVTASGATDARIPPVRARFYHGGSEVHVVDIPGGSVRIPVEIEESELSKSATAEIPANLIQPGLEMVIEIDPGGTLDPALGVQRRIPGAGREAVDVKRMPALQLTWIPMIAREQPDLSILDITRGLTEGSSLFWETRTLLPVDDFKLTVHEPVWTSTRDADALLREVEAIRVMEGGPGHYVGSMANQTGSAGVAHTPGLSSFVAPEAVTVAHELGHNLSLYHAPCGGAGAPDPSFPTANASIGVWGYDFRGGGRAIPAAHKDLMSYCSPHWISDYSFTRALLYRLDQEAGKGAATVAMVRAGSAGVRVGGRAPDVGARADSGHSLLLWGGLDDDGDPVLEPAFVVNAPPVLPPAGGAYRLRGLTASGEELFALGFDMLEASDGGAPSFVFALPARPEWEGSLARITLSGPAGSVSLDGRGGPSMTIAQDARTGRVRGILRGDGARSGVGDAEAAAAVGADAVAESGFVVLFSRGVPGEGW